jgi:hypothetical protein
VVAQMVARGDITAQQARRHVVTNVLGADHPGVRVDVQRVSLEPGDVLLVCSDGLTWWPRPTRLVAGTTAPLSSLASSRPMHKPISTPRRGRACRAEHRRAAPTGGRRPAADTISPAPRRVDGRR